MHWAGRPAAMKLAYLLRAGITPNARTTCVLFGELCVLSLSAVLAIGICFAQAVLPVKCSSGRTALASLNPGERPQTSESRSHVYPTGLQEAYSETTSEAVSEQFIQAKCSEGVR